MHEVVTLQFGNRANYLATHFWNAQESYFTYQTSTDSVPAPSPVDHDIHFRPGIGADGSDTYTPRTLVYDFQSNFGGLRKLNALYETLRPDEVVKGLWDGIQQTQTIPPISSIPYQVNLESGLPTPQLHARDVRYWSDFNRLFYHPRSLVPLSQQSFSTSLNATETWSNGVDLFKDLDREVDLLDRDVRPFVEECDFLSAFQVFSSVDDSWGGYATAYIEALREEFGKKGIWVWAIEDGRRTERTKQYQKLANSARSLRAIASIASSYTRISTVPSVLPEYIQLEQNSDWAIAALMCAAVESVTLPARLRHDSRVAMTNLITLEDMLNTNGSQNVWTVQARARPSHDFLNERTNESATAFNSNLGSQVFDPRIRSSSRNGQDQRGQVVDNEIQLSTFDINFTPCVPIAQSTFPSLTTHQRQSEQHTFAQFESHRFISMDSMPRQTIQPSPETNLQRRYAQEPVLSIYNSPLAFPLLDSYPDNLFHVPTRNRQLLVDAALSTTSATKHDILGLRDLVAGRMGRGLGLIETDDVEAMYDDLTKMGEAYDWGWEGSDDDNEGDEEG